MNLLAACGAALAFTTMAFAAENANSPQAGLRRQLIEEFQNTKVFWQQLEVAEKIVGLHDPSVLPALAGGLNDEDRHVRGNAAFIFASLGDRRGFEVIRNILTDESDRPEGQGLPGGGLVSEGPESDYIKALNHQSRLKAQIRSDRYHAVVLLGDLKDPRAVPILSPLLTDKDVNWAVPFALAQIGDKRAVAPLINELSDNDPDMRVLAIDALQRLHARDAVPALYRLLNDNERCHFDRLISVGQAAKEALAVLEAP